MIDGMIARLGEVLDELGSVTVATVRVRAYAEREGWRLRLIDAGEFSDPAYRANPADRCLFCKRNLYGAILARTEGLVASGTNLDDLGDYRPGLQAAWQFHVRHPYVEAAIDKAGVRAVATHFGLHDLADLPASPCLSSRVETGIRIEPSDLAFIDRIETLLRTELETRVARCRLRREGLVIELDERSLERVRLAERAGLKASLDAMCRRGGFGTPRYEPYRRGSAFLRP
jgi:pyridinium-3,5-biscarboxylic acid mononucleotide sulfurtransferase